jgi:hypothetical protein
MRNQKKRGGLEVKKVRNSSVTRLEVSLPAVIELMPGYEITIEKLGPDERLELEIWREGILGPTVRLGFIITAKTPVPSEIESTLELWI